jgi:spermidine/putrescine transport system ATP-binding protein
MTARTATQDTRVKVDALPLDVELQNVYKFFHQESAVNGIDLNIRQGEFFSILGPSGCGKTTTLRLIAGFERADAGRILIQERMMNHVPPYRRPVNTVFQSYALFNHLNVWDNIAFGLRLKKLSRVEVNSRVETALRLVKMEAMRSRFPAQLSGGQQQRVALARALVNRPAVVLLDEPLAALDLKLRQEMQVELSNLHQDLGLTFIFVTHDQKEALCLSDRIAVMHRGRIEQIGSPKEIYERPSTAFVADFIGDTNLFAGKIANSDRSTLQIDTNTRLKMIVQRHDYTETPTISAPVVVSVRPEKIKLSLEHPSARTNCFAGKLLHVMYLGTHVHYLVEIDSGDRITVLQPNTGNILSEPHTPIYVHWAACDCLALKPSDSE